MLNGNNKGTGFLKCFLLKNPISEKNKIANLWNHFFGDFCPAKGDKGILKNVCQLKIFIF
jgi:hypothetical protein